VHRVRVHPLDILGLRPVRPAVRQCLAAIQGDAYAPPSRFGLTSLAILRPRDAFPLWRGRTRSDRRALITALPNRNPQPPELGYSVQVTSCRDFRGRQLTYDGHLGTDFAVPPGTRITAAAPGVVRAVRKDMQRGGLKIVLDHGGARLTHYNHLAQARVQVGQRVGRGQTIALSGMSSVDGVLFSPWLAPHLHFNALQDGVPIDPFAIWGERSLWIDDRPRPARADDPAPDPGSPWDHDAVATMIASCRDPALQRELLSHEDAQARAAATSTAGVFFAHRFAHRPRLTRRPTARRPFLTLPLHADDYVGTWFADEAPRVAMTPARALRL